MASTWTVEILAQVAEDHPEPDRLCQRPCVECSRTGRPDLAVTGPPRWPAFSAGALAAGIRAVFALPLHVGAIRLGVLDLYRDEPGHIDEKVLTEALHFADAATALLLHLQSLTPVGSEVVAVPVLEDRAEVHQATEVVSVPAGVALPHALALLRARAYAAEQPVLDLARAVLGERVRFDLDDR